MHIVLLPGLDGTGLLFSRFISALGPQCESTVVRYPADRALNYAEHESIARSALPRDRPFIILGESFSGPIAISIAASRPPGLEGVILCCTFAPNPAPHYARFKSLLGLVPFHLIPTAFRSPFVFGRFSSPSLRLEHRDANSRVSNDALRARIKAVFEVDVSAELQQITLPILYLRASQDHVVPKAASEHVQRVAPGVRMVELEAPHLLLQTIPSTAATIVCEFARGLKEPLK
jgi:pimeloyl-ACP methyl ester carboxylesterase